MKPEQPFKDIGDRISIALADAGYTKDRYKNLTEVLVRLFGVSSATVNDWRHGKKCPTMKNALDIAIKLNVCVEWILTGRGPKKPGDDGGHDGDNGNRITFDMTGIPANQRGQFVQALHAVAQSVGEMMARHK